MAISITPTTGAAPEGTAGAAQAAQSSSKLRKSAQEFEAILLQGWLEKMNQSFIGSSESQDAAHDTVSSLGTQAMALALAARGGIGIANMLLRQLQPAERGTQIPEQKAFAPPSTGLPGGPSR